MTRNYKVSFFNVVKEMDDKKVVIGKSYQHLGTINLDDNNVSSTFTLASKAYRTAPQFINADRLEITEIK